jgi:Zn-dependent peptidase ImmA (M78 family)/DNA-binding XRE family transcriptional regulator
MNTTGVEDFMPARLTLARERRGMTKRQLAERAELSDRIIKSYEAGAARPTFETLQSLSQVLGFPLQFFQRGEVEPLALDAVSFRSLARASSALRSRALAAGTLAMELNRFLTDRFDLPAPNLPDLREAAAEAEAAAMLLRQQWGIGQKPIPNSIHLAERHGVRVFALSEDCDSIDAFSCWQDGVPFVFLNTRKTAERSIFDLAHELGHLALHRHGTPQGQEAEAQADAFASAFLLPEGPIRACAPQVATIASICQLKRTWRASAAAIVRRLFELELTTAWHYRRINIELSRRGRQNEPEPIERETSAVLDQALAALSEEGVGLRQIAGELMIPIGELRALCFGFGTVIGGGAGGGSPRGALRLVQ